MNNNLDLKAKIGGMYSFKVKRADGTVEDLGHQRNLITNIGIDRIFNFAATTSAVPFAELAIFARIGTGNTAASVNDTALQTQTASSNTFVTSAGACGTTVNTAEGSATHKRTFQFAAAGGSSTINEVGMGWTASTASTLFSRIVLNTPISLNTGDILYVIYTLKIIFDQIANASAVNLTTGTFALVGDLKITGAIVRLLGNVLSTGAQETTVGNRPCHVLTGFNGSANVRMRTGTNTAFPTVNTDGSLTSVSTGTIGAAVSHTIGTATFSASPEMPGAGAISGIRSITIGFFESIVNGNAIWILLDADQTKEDLKFLKFTYTVTYTQV
jgi:hypothetical protein